MVVVRVSSGRRRVRGVRVEVRTDRGRLVRRTDARGHARFRVHRSTRVRAVRVTG